MARSYTGEISREATLPCGRSTHPGGCKALGCRRSLTISKRPFQWGRLTSWPPISASEELLDNRRLSASLLRSKRTCAEVSMSKAGGNRVLVVGGTRGAGCLIARLLHERGYDVRVLARDPA